MCISGCVIIAQQTSGFAHTNYIRKSFRHDRGFLILVVFDWESRLVGESCFENGLIHYLNIRNQISSESSRKSEKSPLTLFVYMCLACTCLVLLRRLKTYWTVATMRKKRGILYSDRLLSIDYPHLVRGRYRRTPFVLSGDVCQITTFQITKRFVEISMRNSG